ncbi:MAG: DUF1800 domain-containing protein [Armatimonadetes bacterium]|nr:DUF1800 domain-containing protein [Armatimonadota bacterium]
MTEREKIAHLLRRFAFGGTYPEMLRYEKLGFKATADKLFDLGTDPENPEIFRFFFKKGEDAEPNTYRLRCWWFYKCATTSSPLRERMTLFWHDHFAVSDNKIEDGLSMVAYLQELRKNPLGRFEDILREVVTQPAFLKELDVQIMKKGSPNENFARELLELYTLGEGNYTETDIKEVARAITGWSFIETFYSQEATNNVKLRQMQKTKTPFTAFSIIPAFHDRSSKTVLGKKGDFDGIDVLKLLAHHPKTAMFITKKLWEHFAYINPEATIIDRLSQVYLNSDTSIASVMKAMIAMSEFWSTKALGTRVKSPFDLIFGLERALYLGRTLQQKLGPAQSYDSPVDQPIIDLTGGIAYHMSNMGLDALYPDSVAGWDWGHGWISSNTMMKRIRYDGVNNWYEKEKNKYWPTPGMMGLVEVMRGHMQKPVEEFTKEFLSYFDAKLSPEPTAVITEHFKKFGHSQPRADNDFGWMLQVALKALVAAPEFHFH